MHIHILGIAGTFMGGLAVLARELNFKVTGSDQAIYPPMSTQLLNMGIELIEGYESDQLTVMPDCVVVGNVMRRGFPVIETLLNQGTRMFSGPEWLAQYVLQKRHVLAVSGTHGKTTTSSMLAWILEVAGLSPGFLIGGIPINFGISARLGKMPYFVVEADEYDSAFFDKRSKFIHYRPKTLIINNIEYDHADIFPTLAAIEQQFHHLIRTVPSNGVIVYPNTDITVARVLKMGNWSTLAPFSPNQNSGNSVGWHAKTLTREGDKFDFYYDQKPLGRIEWNLLGQHNISNALAAMIAAEHVGVSPEFSAQALCRFAGVKRRLEVKGQVEGITVYDDFAHHPTAIATTLEGLRAKVGNEDRIIAVIEIRSNTMRSGHHQEHLPASFLNADEVYFLKSTDIIWEVEKIWQACNKPGGVYSDISPLIKVLQDKVKGSDHVVFMSNGGFGGIQKQFLDAMRERV